MERAASVAELKRTGAFTGGMIGAYVLIRYPRHCIGIRLENPVRMRMASERGYLDSQPFLRQVSLLYSRVVFMSLPRLEGTSFTGLGHTETVFVKKTQTICAAVKCPR